MLIMYYFYAVLMRGDHHYMVRKVRTNKQTNKQNGEMTRCDNHKGVKRQKKAKTVTAVCTVVFISNVKRNTFTHIYVHVCEVFAAVGQLLGW